jgi:hypothetical protein
LRFEVIAAFVLGVLLPVLETLRRGFEHWAIESTTMLEDYLAGAALLAAGWAAARGAKFADPLLLAVWSGVGTMMTLSFIGQIEETLRAVELEPHNSAVLVIKSLLWASCAIAVGKSFHAVRRAAA